MQQASEESYSETQLKTIIITMDLVGVVRNINMEIEISNQSSNSRLICCFHTNVLGKA